MQEAAVVVLAVQRAARLAEELRAVLPWEEFRRVVRERAVRPRGRDPPAQPSAMPGRSGMPAAVQRRWVPEQGEG